MATLTDEQRKRIEENKRKALAIRAAKMASAAAPAIVQPSSSNIPALPVSSSAPKINSLPNTVTNNSNNFKPNNGAQKPQYHSFNNNPSGKDNSKDCVVKVNFVLRSKERFTIDFVFHDEIVAQLKTVNGRLYGRITHFNYITLQYFEIAYLVFRFSS